MILSIFLGILIGAILFFILGYFEDSVGLTAISMVFWIVLVAGSVGIEIPYETIDSTGTVTTGTHVIQELGLSAIMLGMVIICMIMMIGMWSDFKRLRKFRI